MRLERDDPLAVAVVAAIHAGDVDALDALLTRHPGLARAGIATPDGTRSLLHVATDWPARRPRSAETVATLAAHGADVRARFTGGAHAETPLHWAASADDVAALDALLDHGAEIDADGAVIGGGTALADAVAFGQWDAARRLVERGASTTLWQAAALGMTEAVERDAGGATPDELANAFWCACHGGQRATAELLLARGAERDRPLHDGLTPLAAAARSGADDVVDWLRAAGAR